MNINVKPTRIGRLEFLRMNFLRLNNFLFAEKKINKNIFFVILSFCKHASILLNISNDK
jgi:hypothetical protein